MRLFWPYDDVKKGSIPKMNSKTMFYILKRLLLALLTVWVVITITFFSMHAIPGGPFMSEKAVSQEVMDALNAKYGLMPGGNVPSGPNLITKEKANQVIELSAKGIR